MSKMLRSCGTRSYLLAKSLSLSPASHRNNILQHRLLSSLRPRTFLAVKVNGQGQTVPRRGLKLGWLLGPPPKAWSKDYWKLQLFYAFAIVASMVTVNICIDQIQISGYLVPELVHTANPVYQKPDYPFMVKWYRPQELEMEKMQRERLIELFESEAEISEAAKKEETN